MPWSIARVVILTQAGIVVGAQIENGGSYASAEPNTIGFFGLVVGALEVFLQSLVEGCFLRREKGSQRIVRGLAHSYVERNRSVELANSRVAIIAADDGIDRVENRDVHDGHGAARPSWPQLFAENAILTRRDGRVI